MKRSSALLPLSREHHQALVAAKRIQDKAAQGQPALLDYWFSIREELADELNQHFLEEENGFGHLLTGDIKQRFESDHQTLRQLLETDQHDEIVRFAEQLRDHVRFEEREMFSWLEQKHLPTLSQQLSRR